jgi:linoleate 10R-lipoxygenase
LGRNQNVTYAFREADGSSYNVLFPTLGRAGEPYARSVASTISLPLPDAGLVFDTLLRQEGGFQKHPGGLSSLFFSFADLVIHSIFNTARTGFVNNASSYLDLSPLYGSSNEEVDTVRRKDGTGKLWNDVFADTRFVFVC